MTKPEITQFAGQLPEDGDQATFLPRAQALFDWLVGEYSPDSQVAIDWMNAALLGLNTDASGLPSADVDLAIENGIFWGYGAAHVSASTGDNPFDALDGVFAVLVLKADAGAATENVAQLALSLSSSVEIVSRARAGAGWGAWVSISPDPTTVLKSAKLSAMIAAAHM